MKWRSEERRDFVEVPVSSKHTKSPIKVIFVGFVSFFKFFPKTEEIEIPGLGAEDRVISAPVYNNRGDPFNRPTPRTGFYNFSSNYFPLFDETFSSFFEFFLN